MATQEQIIAICGKLESYYGKGPRDMDPYYWALEDYPADIIAAAAKEHVKSNKYHAFPLAADLRALCDTIQAQKEHEQNTWEQAAHKYIQDHEGIRTAWLYSDIMNKYLSGELPQQALDAFRTVAGITEPAYNQEYDKPDPRFSEVDNATM